MEGSFMHLKYCVSKENVKHLVSPGHQSHAIVYDTRAYHVKNILNEIAMVIWFMNNYHDECRETAPEWNIEYAVL